MKINPRSDLSPELGEKIDLQQDDSEKRDEDPGASEHVVLRDRYYDLLDESRFCNWISTDIPVELEIGAGKGLFLTNAAKANAQHRFVGLELAGKYAIDCQSKVDRLGIANVQFFACDAVAVIDRDVPDGSLNAVHCYFPDPWWKSRHKKRRVLNEQTLRNIERTLIPNGEFHFWTDVLDYYESTLELIDQVTQLKGPFFVSEPVASHDMDYRTHFERRTRKNGLPVYRSRFTKS
jgi:tRNA (guanine-N7-)-methyltransferase